MTEIPIQNPASVLVDAHVHFHDCFSWEVFLNAAAANFALARRELAVGNDSPGCMMLTESAGVNYFCALVNEPKLVSSFGWRVTATGEDCSVLLTSAERDTIIVVAGRQIVTAESLEVLALGTTEEVPDGRAIREVLDAVVNLNATAVVPWGFGKWWGRRSRIVTGMLLFNTGLRIFLGDNGGRPTLSMRPRLFSLGEAKGVFVLPGSDPLPFADHAGRAGRYGFVLNQRISLEHPYETIRAGLRGLTASPRVFGRREGLARFAVSQFRMQLRKGHRTSQR